MTPAQEAHALICAVLADLEKSLVEAVRMRDIARFFLQCDEESIERIQAHITEVSALEQRARKMP